jgi:hypothetical protein
MAIIGSTSMVGNYLQRAIDEIRSARSELPPTGRATPRDVVAVREGVEALLDGLQDIDRRLSSLEKGADIEAHD